MPNCNTHSKKCKAGCIDGFFGDSCDKSCEEITNTTLCTKCEKLESVGITVCLECQSGEFVSQFGIPPLQLTQNNGKHAAVS
jgi:hypothetical protein